MKWLKDILGITALEEQIVQLKAINYNQNEQLKLIHEASCYGIKVYGDSNDKEVYAILKKIKKASSTPKTN